MTRNGLLVFVICTCYFLGTIVPISATDYAAGHDNKQKVTQKKQNKRTINSSEIQSEEQDWARALQINSIEAFTLFKQKYPSSPLVLIGDVYLKEAPIPTFFLYSSFAQSDKTKVIGSCFAVNGGLGISLPLTSLTQNPVYPIPLKDAILWGLVTKTVLSSSTTLPGEFFMKKGGGRRTKDGLEYDEGSQATFGLAPPDEQGNRFAVFELRNDIAGKVVKVVSIKETGTYRVIDVKLIGEQKGLDLISRNLIVNVDLSAWLEKTFKVSPDSKHVAYIAKDGEKGVVVLDGKGGKQYDNFIPPLVFSPDSKHLAYSAVVADSNHEKTHADKFIVVVDGKEGKQYDDIGYGSLVFSPDGKHLAYGAYDNNKWLVVVDGKDGKRYDSAHSLVFSPDGKHTAYAAREGNKWFVVVDGKEGQQYDSIGGDSLVFSPDNRNLSYAAKAGNKVLVVVNGKEGKRYDSAHSIVFSPDGKHMAYAAREGNKSFVIIDEKEGKKYDGIGGGSLIFSPDGKHLAYAAQVATKWLMVIDEKEGKQYSSVSPLIFSPDSKRMAYYVLNAVNKAFVVVDGLEQKQYDFIGQGTLTFSPDSRHVVYGAQDNAKWLLVIDGKEHNQVDHFINQGGGRLLFDSHDTFHFLVRNGSNIYLIENRLR